jgi:hypothetical protein
MKRLVALALLAASPAQAQRAPADLTVLPPVPIYASPKTAWGDPDLRGIYPLDNASRVPFERPADAGNRVWQTPAEFAARLDAAKRSDASYSADSSRGTKGLADWMQAEPFARRTSALVSPSNGRLPALTPTAETLRKAGRSSWVNDQERDWLTDFDTWDRCVTRGFPASMMPFRYNNGVRIFQSPGFLVVHFEMLGDRVIPLSASARKAPFESWLGSSVGHWEGQTLVVETDHIKTGNGATDNLSQRAASPLNVATGIQSNNAIPVSSQAKAVERFTRTGPNTLVYELTYSDPEVFTAPWTSRVSWTRDMTYQFYEYACHEGNVSIRNNIMTSRAARRQAAAGN